MSRKLVLAVIDALHPALLDRAIEEGRAPVLARLAAGGTYVRDSVSAYPSVTPACAASIATGAAPDEHGIPSMNWYHRGEGRYVEYGSSFKASRVFGFKRSLTDTVYRMNAEHLNRATPTFFELLDDAGVRTAGTTYLMYRGRYRHEAQRSTALTRLASSVGFSDPVYGPREFFYADIFASRRTPCRSQLGKPGVRDQHAGCVGAYLVEEDLFDFFLLSLPDVDTHSHRYGPDAQVVAIEEADRQLARMAEVAGGIESFLESHAVLVVSDHAQSAITSRVDLFAAFGDRRVVPATGDAPDDAEIAICPAARSAMLYVRREDERDAWLPVLERQALGVAGVDLTMRLVGGEAVVRAPAGRGGGELRFAPGDAADDLRGRSWSFTGDDEVLGLAVYDGRVSSARYPDALGRIWSALHCERGGDLLLSAAPGAEFVDWGGGDHVGGGSHGSLDAEDSHAVLLHHGLEHSDAVVREQWTLRDVVPLVCAHFGVQRG